MGCGNDKIKSFLTKPKARTRRRFEQLQEAEEQEQNQYNSKTRYRATILGLPRPIDAKGIQSTDNGEYIAYVRIRIEELDNGKPSPDTQSFDSKATLKSIASHRWALVPIEHNNLQLGEVYEVEFDTPAPIRQPYPPKIRSFVGTNTVFAENVRANIDSTTAAGRAFLGGGFSSLSSYANDHPPKERDYYLNGNQNNMITIKNGFYNTWPRDIRNYYDKTATANVGPNKTAQVISYESTVADGNFLIAHPQYNFASNLVQFATAYYKKWGHGLRIAGGGRSYDKQAELWAKFQREGYPIAAKPGKSNHGWGLAIDIHPMNKGSEYGTDETKWIIANIGKYGFDNVEGKNLSTPEPWHFTVKASLRNGILGPIRSGGQ